MKALHAQSTRVSLSTLLLIVGSCNQRRVLDPINLYIFTRGYWEWVSTTTPSGTITPQTIGYTKQMVQGIDSKSGGQSINFVAFYKNDTLQQRYNEVENQQYIPDYIGNTISVKYDTVGFLKYHVTPNSPSDNYIQIGEFRNPYTQAADTVISIYKSNPDLRGILSY